MVIILIPYLSSLLHSTSPDSNSSCSSYVPISQPVDPLTQACYPAHTHSPACTILCSCAIVRILDTDQFWGAGVGDSEDAALAYRGT